MSGVPRGVRHLVASLTVLAVALGCDQGMAPVWPPDALLQPGCATPAPVYGTLHPTSPAFIVTYRSGTDPAAETTRLAARYGFTPQHVYQAIPGFAANLTRETVRDLRCEPTVAHLEYDGRAGVATSP
jgi:hypothetical protein